MSLVEISQTEDSLRGVGIYEANDEWKLEPPTTEDDLVHLPVVTDEGSGSWLIFNRTRGLWGTILRSDDSPYNDCLPPSEQLLLNSFRAKDSMEELLKDFYERSDDQFLNPFFAVLGDVSNGTLAWFKGSFQCDHGELELGHYVFRDNVAPNASDESAELDATSVETLQNQLEENIENGAYADVLNQDGMRSPQRTVVFEFTRDRFTLEYAAEYTSNPDWTTHSSGAVREP